MAATQTKSTRLSCLQLVSMLAGRRYAELVLAFRGGVKCMEASGQCCIIILFENVLFGLQ